MPNSRHFTGAMGNRMAFQPAGVPVSLANRRRNPERDCHGLTLGPRGIGAGSHASPSRPPAVGAVRRGPVSYRPNALSQGAASNRQCRRKRPGCSKARAALGAHPGDVACRVARAVHPRFASAYCFASRGGRAPSAQPGSRSRFHGVCMFSTALMRATWVSSVSRLSLDRQAWHRVRGEPRT
jgi:hypothetical protein